MKAESKDGKMTYMQRHIRKKELLMSKVSPKRMEVVEGNKLSKVVHPQATEYLST